MNKESNKIELSEKLSSLITVAETLFKN